MTKKPKNENKEAGKAAAKAKATAKAKAKKPEQLKIAGTGRVDSIEAIDSAAVAYREALEARMEMQKEEEELQADLTKALRDNKVTRYQYEGPDGKLYEAYVPSEDELKAKVRRVKEPKAPKAAPAP